ncbi:MAG: hypothetical protein JKY67_00095 [Pseudomonadales bacterium]|nr:hypothetical protein [Pseudomonadales bacterium]
MSIDQLLFEWIKGELDIAGVTNIVGTNESIVRDDFTTSLLVTPRVEYNSWRTRDQTLGGVVTLSDGGFGITVVCDRDDAFGDGDTPEAAGDLHSLLDAVQGPLVGIVPTLAGFLPKAIKLEGVRRTTLSDLQHVSIRLDFSLNVFDGLTTAPISGGDGDLDFDELAGTVVRWVAMPDARHDTLSTSEDDGVPIWEPNDLTNRVRVWFMPEPVAQPAPLAGSIVTANFDIHSGVSWVQSLKIDRYTWPQDLTTDDPLIVVIDLVDDDVVRSPWLGATI